MSIRSLLLQLYCRSLFLLIFLALLLLLPPYVAARDDGPSLALAPIQGTCATPIVARGTNFTRGTEVIFTAVQSRPPSNVGAQFGRTTVATDGTFTVDIPRPVVIAGCSGGAPAPAGAQYTISAERVTPQTGDAGGVLASATFTVAAPSRCFQETGQCVQGRFLDYWQANGGLVRNGFPLSGELIETLEDGRAHTVQYFERVRLEYHPENTAPYDILLGQFGRHIRPADAPVSQQPGSTYFAETGHNVSGDFLAYWEANGGLAQFGYPLSEEISEPIDGKPYTVQYFERARFEYHPENADPQYQVLLGQFGRQILATQPAASPPLGCRDGDGLGFPSYPGYTIEQLVWSSHQIVAGEVVERLPTIAVASREGPSTRVIYYTDYAVRVAGRVRGLPSDTIRVRLPGGTIGACTQVEPNNLPLAPVVGGLLLLFLTAPQVDMAVPTYILSGGPQGRWGIADDGSVTTIVNEYATANGLPLTQFTAQLRGVLEGLPPANLGNALVPLDQAPLVPAP